MAISKRPPVLATEGSTERTSSRRELLAVAGAGALALGVTGFPLAAAAAPAAETTTLSTLQAASGAMLGEIYDAEFQFLAAMQQVLPLVTDPALASGIQVHIVQTQGHIARLQQVFALLGLPPARSTSATAAALVASAQQLISMAPAGRVRDTVIDGSLDKAEHFEIASYVVLVNGANAALQLQAAGLLSVNLAQEVATSRLLESLLPQLMGQAASYSQTSSFTGQ